jgi:hypothetical protein
VFRFGTSASPKRQHLATLGILFGLATRPVFAQTVDPPPQHHHGGTETAPALFPVREASGTAWLPDETPMEAVQRKMGPWDVMFHGAVFGQLLYEPGDRHRTGGNATVQASSANWVMAMARRRVGDGARAGLRAMVSAEPWTVRDCGFINLLASGEVCEGDTIHDRQHPHDLFMELAADYDRPISEGLRWQVYGGFAGEPALGPVAFPHRSSAMPNPVAPITHHWLDSSHVTFGVVTSGLYSRRWKTEASLFNGREPDAERADIDLGPLDSVSGRLTVMPTPRLALQISAAHLRGAEADVAAAGEQPRHDVERVTASATYHHTSPSAAFATMLAYGVNAGPEEGPGDLVDLATHALLLETSITVRERQTWFGRFEVVGKAGHDLHIHESPAAVFTVAKLQGGYVRVLRASTNVVSEIGGTVSISVVPSALASRYSGRVAPGFGVFLRLRPPRHAM